jgi:hypothetical protein
MSLDEVAAKFSDCAAAARWPESKTKAIIAMVKRVEDLKDVRELTALCAISANR